MTPGLPEDSSGCSGGVCITLGSQGGRGLIIIQFDATSATTATCAQFRYLANGAVVAQSPSRCSGSGYYATSWRPNVVFADRTSLCAEDVVSGARACEMVLA